MKDIRYKEYPLKTAILLFPFLVPALQFTGIDIEDDNYICRIDNDGLYEFGYKNDKNWTLC